MKILITIIIILFFYNRNIIQSNIIEAINIWYKNLFPTIFPTLIISDLIIAYNLMSIIVKLFGKLFTKIFKISKYGIMVFIISLICGTPTNMVILKSLYDLKLLSNEDVNKLIPLCLLFNPLFVIKFTNLKCLIIITISSIIASIIFRKFNYLIIDGEYKNNNKFILNEVLEKNMKIVINILGIVSIFMALSSIIQIKKPIVSCIIACIFEITTGLFKINIFYNNNIYLYLFALSFGGLSIFIQIKYVLKDIKLNYKIILFQRLIVYLISTSICILT
jgi:hypothetical protein